MKKVKYLFLILLCAVLCFSCSNTAGSDDNNPVIPESPSMATVEGTTTAYAGEESTEVNVEFYIPEISTARTASIRAASVTPSENTVAITGTLLSTGNTSGSIKIDLSGLFDTTTKNFSLSAEGSLSSVSISVSFTGTLDATMKMADTDLSITITSGSDVTTYSSYAVSAPATAGTVATTISGSGVETAKAASILPVYRGTWSADNGKICNTPIGDDEEYKRIEVTVTDSEIIFKRIKDNGDEKTKTYSFVSSLYVENGTQTDDDITYATINQFLVVRPPADDTPGYYVIRLKTKTSERTTKLKLYTYAMMTAAEIETYEADDDDSSNFVPPYEFDSTSEPSYDEVKTLIETGDTTGKKLAEGENITLHP